MTIFNIRKLCAQLAKDEVSESFKMLYLLAGTFIYLIISYFSIYPIPEIGPLYYSEFGIVITINAAGIYYAFLCNGGEQGKYFIERFISLTVPISIWCFVIFWVLYIAFFRITDPTKLGLTELNATRVLDIATYITVVSIEVLFYVLMVISFKRIVKIEKNTQQQNQS